MDCFAVVTRLGRCLVALLLLSTSSCKVPIVGSAYAFVGPGLQPVDGFGRYSYVVFHKFTMSIDPTGKTGSEADTNLAFEYSLVNRIVAADRVTPADRRSYNVFEHAVKPGFIRWSKSSDMDFNSIAEFLLTYYDYDYGKLLVQNICKHEVQFHQICKFDKGPYIVSVSRPLPQGMSLSTDLGRDVYVYDCSPFTAPAYDEIIRVLLEKVKISDQRADGGLASVYTSMLQLPLTIGDAAVKSTDAVKAFFFKPF